jgi:hypothetical protein
MGLLDPMVRRVKEITMDIPTVKAFVLTMLKMVMDHLWQNEAHQILRQERITSISLITQLQAKIITRKVMKLVNV